MERVAFLIDATGERIGCMLNPDSVTVRRLAGLRPRRSTGGLVTGTQLADDPLVATGGGRTEIELDLLFDVTLGGSTIVTDNVQGLTGPLWDLAENGPDGNGYGEVRLVRLVWGKTWNVPAVVAAVSERFERFSSTGVPERSWLRLRLIRVGDPVDFRHAIDLPAEPTTEATSPPVLPDIPEDQVTFHEVVGGDDAPAERLDEIAAQYYGDPGLWRVLAAYNGIADPLHIPPPRVLRIPPVDAVRSLA
jgi:Contractile injection system tube protein